MARKRAFIVNRVSKEEQRKYGYSLETQLEACKSFAEQLDAEVVRVISDNFSATSSDSVFEGLEPVFDAVEAGEVDLVIFFEIDRVTRGGLGEMTVIVNRLRNAGATVGYAKRKAMAGTTPDEQMMDGMYALIAQREWQTTRERTMRGIRGKAKRGIFIGNGKPPYGYNRLVDPERGTTAGLEINEEQAEVVRNIYRWFVYGEDGQRLGVKDIVERLRLAKIPNPGAVSGKRNPVQKRGPFEWSTTTIYDILRHTAYNGTAYAFKWKMIGRGSTKKSHLQRVRPQEEWIPTKVPVIVDDATWNAAQALLDEGKQRSTRNTKFIDLYLLGRRIRCACGYAINGSSHQSPINSGDVRIHTYYRCSAKIPHHVAGTCKLPSIRTERVDNEVWEWVKRRLLSFDEVANNVATNERKTGRSEEHFNARILAYAREIEELDQGATILLRQLRKQLIDEGEFAREKEAINEEKAAKQAAIDRLEKQRDAARLEGQRRASLGALVDEYRLRAEYAELGQRRGIIEALDVSVVLAEHEPGVLRAEVYSLFDFDPDQDTLIIPIGPAERPKKMTRKPK